MIIFKKNKFKTSKKYHGKPKNKHGQYIFIHYKHGTIQS